MDVIINKPIAPVVRALRAEPWDAGSHSARVGNVGVTVTDEESGDYLVTIYDGPRSWVILRTAALSNVTPEQVAAVARVIA